MAKKPNAAMPLDPAAGVTVLAERAMWRAGRAWAAGATDLSSAEVAALGAARLRQLQGDPNFVLAAFGTEAAAIAGTDDPAFQAAVLVVHAQRSMTRAGRAWNKGATPLDAAQAKALGETGIARLKADPNFTVIERPPSAAPPAA